MNEFKIYLIKRLFKNHFTTKPLAILSYETKYLLKPAFKEKIGCKEPSPRFPRRRKINIVLDVKNPDRPFGVGVVGVGRNILIPFCFKLLLSIQEN
jgi:hypothetical protein